MVRNYKRKINKENISNEIILKAVKSIKIERKSFRKTTMEFGINIRTLTRYCKKVTYEQLLDPAFNFNFHYKNIRQVRFRVN